MNIPLKSFNSVSLSFNILVLLFHIAQFDIQRKHTTYLRTIKQFPLNPQSSNSFQFIVKQFYFDSQSNIYLQFTVRHLPSICKFTAKHLSVNLQSNNLPFYVQSNIYLNYLQSNIYHQFTVNIYPFGVQSNSHNLLSSVTYVSIHDQPISFQLTIK